MVRPIVEINRIRVTLSVRTTGDMRARLIKAAAASGRSLSQEIELRLERSFDQDRLRDILREELAHAAD